MKNKLLIAFSTGLLFLCFTGLSMAVPLTTISLGSGISFQDYDNGIPGLTYQNDDTAKLMTQDFDLGPSVVGSVWYDYYATGTSGRYFDAVSLSFDLSAIGWSNVANPTLRFFLQTGDYVQQDPNDGLNWHHYQILPGAFNPANEDVGPASAPGAISFDYFQFLNGGWIEAALDPNWIVSDTFELTLRLWNVRLDAVEMTVASAQTEAASVPEPATIFLMGLGLIGFAGFTRRKIKK